MFTLKSSVAITLAAVTPATAVEIVFQQHTIDVAENEVADVLAIDFDFDGDIDVLSASEVEDRVVLFLNDGAEPPVFTRMNIITTAPGVVTFDAADIDGDGVYDIVTGTESDDAISWWKLTPDKKMPMNPDFYAPVEIATVSNPTRVRAADVDDDGDTDVLFAGFGTFGWLENDGQSPPSFTEHPIPTASLLPRDFRIADLNGDGDRDIVLCGTNATVLAWYRNDGQSPPDFAMNQLPITTTLTQPRSLVITDLNNDLDPDIAVVSESDTALAWYESDGSNPPAFTEHLIPDALPSAIAVATEDLDSNGTADLIVASAAADALVWFDSDGANPPVFTQRPVFAPVLNSAPADVTIADLDGDSDPDVLAATRGNDTVVYYENTLAPVRNLTQNTAYQTLSEALASANNDDLIVVASFIFGTEPMIDFDGVGARLRSSRGIAQPEMGQYILADGAQLTASSISSIDIAGELRVPLAARTEIDSASASFSTNAVLYVDPQATFVMETNGTVNNSGIFDILGGSVLTDGTIENPGEIAMIQGTLAAAALNNTGDFSGSGDLFATVTTSGTFTTVADSLVAGDFTNDGTVTVQSGVLTILGALTNNGTIIGDTNGTRGNTAGGMFINGDFILGTPSTLTLQPGDAVSVAGRFDAAIDDWNRFDLSNAVLRLTGTGAVQTLEAMSQDIGPSAAGLTRGPSSFPIGTLAIGPTPASVQVIDIRDNVPGQSEAIYTSHLEITSGASLSITGVNVYYQTINVQGTVDSPSNLIPLGPSCPADLTNDNAVDSTDLAVLLASWGQAGGGDLNFDGNINSADLAILLAAWGACP